TLDGSGQATSDAASGLTTLGQYCWRAEYSGDSIYNAASHSDGTAECFTLAKQPVSVTTQASATTTKASDVATIAGGGPAPAGTVDSFLCAPAQVTWGGCVTGGTQIGGDVAVQADGTATSAMATITQSGKYCWRTVYSGDSFYLGSTDTNTSSECFTPTKQTAALSTSAIPNGGHIVARTPPTDTA